MTRLLFSGFTSNHKHKIKPKPSKSSFPNSTLKYTIKNQIHAVVCVDIPSTAPPTEYTYLKEF